MQRKYLGIAIAMFATMGPVAADGGDREIAEQIISRLNHRRDTGQLKDFTLDMKVDKGVVLFRGNVGQEAHKQLILNATDGIDGIANVVDQVSVTAPAVSEPMQQVLTPIDVRQPAIMVEKNVEPVTAENQLTLAQALAVEAQAMQKNQTPQVMPGEVRPASAIESSSDQEVVAGVIDALQNAKRNGQLRGFGVDVQSTDGVLQLTGRAGSADQRDQIVRIAQGVPGVSGIREAISIPATENDAPPLSAPQTLQPIADSQWTPLDPPQVSRRPLANSMQGTPAQMASSGRPMPAMTAPYRMHAQQAAPTQAMPASMGYGMAMAAPVAGQPVPMAPHSPVGAPRYDSPNLPNYAWPGYSSYPNYAALSYPQQYSPSAWPYIGPFYPYPQVPLGWRKISLEWDDGWWFLDFTDK